MPRTPIAKTPAAAAARRMLPAYAHALITAHTSALQALAAVARTQGEASTALTLDALVELRRGRAGIEAAEAQILGVLVLAGQARSTLARATGCRAETLTTRLKGTPASWAGRELVPDTTAVGGWRPA